MAEVRSGCTLCEWSDLKPGQFFIVKRREPEWCLRVSLDDNPDCSIVFSQNDVRGGGPWVSVGAQSGFPIQVFPDAYITTNWRNSVKCADSDVPLGAIRSVDRRNLLLATVSPGRHLWLDVETGSAQPKVAGHDGIFYPSWSLERHVTPEKSEQLFSL